MSGQPPLYAVGFLPDTFSPYSGMWPVADVLGARRLEYRTVWSRVQQRSWTAGNWLRQWGNHHYGSAWNSFLPGWDERRVRRALPHESQSYPVHFLWAEFGAPVDPAPYHRQGAQVIITVHCSARRWESVWLKPDRYARADHVVLTSESQRPFVERNVPPQKISTILHGVVSEHYRPPDIRQPRTDRLRLFMLGNTERDHEFTAQVAARLPAQKFEWRIRTSSHEQSLYAGVASVNLLPQLSDEEMLTEYQQADLLAMPMLDSAANNVLLESMACGTPVMVNRVGGVPEYVSPECNFVMSNDRNVDEWVEKLLWLEQNRDVVERMRPATRTWAEKFDWKLIAEDYRAMYREVMGRSV